MPHIIEDRILESSTTTGVGAMTLAGAITGFRRFSAVCAVGDTVPYFIEAIDSLGQPTGDYEYGLGTYSAANTLTRTTVEGSSNAGAPVNFAAGSKNVGIGLTKRETASRTAAFGECVLVKSGANLLLKPYRGNRLTINGQPCTVPDAGVSLAPAGLAVGTLYYIYATASNGVVNALEASATAHATDTAAGNKGVEIKAGDSTRSLVGMAVPVAGPAFADTTTNRQVRSWFNDSGLACHGSYGANVVCGFATWGEVDPNYRATALMWAGEQWSATGKVTCLDTGGGAGTMYGSLGVNAVQSGFYAVVTAAGAATYRGDSFGSSGTSAADALTTFTLLGGIVGGAAPTYVNGTCGYTVRTVRAKP